MTEIGISSTIAALVAAIISAFAVLGGSWLSSRFTMKAMNKQLENMRTEGEKQRQFAAQEAELDRKQQIEISKQQFFLQQKLHAYEYALRTLPEYPRDKQMLRETWSAAALLKMYIPNDGQALAVSFDLRGPKTSHIRGGTNVAPNSEHVMEWTKNYGELYEYIRSEIRKLSN